MVRRIDPARLPDTLEVVVIGGEVCPPETVARWAERVRMINVYGPTEATICTSLCECDARSWSKPLIGAPIPGVRYEVVDEALSPIESDRSGELLILGTCLALGYVEHAELEAQKFIFFCGERAYRTGDRVRRFPDGTIEFLGRIDRQRKIRGMLVEPEEIEHCLRQHPSVERAAVVLRESGTGVMAGAPSDRLVAFVASSDARLAGEALRRHTLEKLPRWMCPVRFEVLTQLPETTSGKVDLAMLESMALAEPRVCSPPRGDRERVLARIWCDVLHLEAIDRDHDFLTLGGDSIAVMECVAAAEASGLAVSAAQLYAGKSLAKLAHHDPDVSVMTAGALRDDARRVCEPRSPRGIDRPSRAGSILLTGGTGFLGARVLHELLRQTDSSIHCLVRSHSADDGIRRLEVAARAQGLTWADEHRLRVVVHPGDVSRPRFGLASQEWGRLADEVASIHHLAAVVNLVLPYDRLREANVVATGNAIELARAGAQKHLHYASTLSVAACASPTPERFFEDDTLARTELVFGGYAQSKWAAEVLVAESGTPATIYRLGLLTGDSLTGRSARTCQLLAFLRSIAALGAFPEISLRDADRLRVDVTPVDFAARALVCLSIDRALEPDVFHLASPRPLSLARILRAVRSRGVELRTVSADAFRRRMAAAESTPSSAMAALSWSHRLLSTGDRHRMADLFLATDVSFDTTRAARILEPAGIRCPLADDALLERYLDQALGRWPAGAWS